jgi:hypothetical protein
MTNHQSVFIELPTANLLVDDHNEIQPFEDSLLVPVSHPPYSCARAILESV